MNGRRNRGLLALAGIIGILIIITAIFLWNPSNTSSRQESQVTQEEPGSTEAPVPSEAEPADLAAANALAEASTVIPDSTTAESDDASAAIEEPGVEAVIYGRVTSKATNQPVADARVMLHKFDTAFGAKGMEKPKAETVTDKDGNYRLASKIDLSAGGFGQNIIRAEADGFATRGALILNADSADKRIDFLLDYGGKIQGRVLNEDKQPVADATVGSFVMEQPNIEAMIQGIPTMLSPMTTSDASGNFTLMGIPEDHPVALPVRAEGYLPGLSDPFEAGDTDVVITVLRGEARMHGKVLLPDGTPVRNAMLLASPENTLNSFSVADIASRVMTDNSDENGNYEFEALPAGTLQIQIFDASNLLQSNTHEEKVTLEKGDDLEKNFTMPAPAVVHGRAISSEDNTPIAGVKVSKMPYFMADFMPGATNAKTAHSDEVISDHDGRFVIKATNAGGGNAIFYFDPPAGWIADSQMPYNMHLFPVNTTGEPHEVELKFKRGATLQGIVLSKEGAPVDGADIRLNSLSSEQYGIPRHATSDVEGKFMITGNFKSKANIQASHKLGYAQTEVEFPAEGNPDPIELRLDKYGQVSGVVKNDKGEPMAGVAIKILPDYTAGQMTFFSPISSNTDAKGYYFAENVQPGKLNVSAHPLDTSGYGASDPKSVTIKAGEHVENMDFVLRPGDFIKGTITDEEDKPVVGAMVMPYYENQSPGMLTAQSDKEGKYELRGLPVDKTIDMLIVFHQQYEQEMRQAVSIFDGPQDFQLKKLRPMTLIARESGTDKPITNYEYRFLMSRGDMWMVSPFIPAQVIKDPNGIANIPQMRAGKWRIEIAEMNDESQPTGRRGNIEFEWPLEDKSTEVVVPVAGGRRVTGRVVMQGTDDPVAEAAVELQAAQQYFNTGAAQSQSFTLPATKTDSAGRFVLEGVPAGTHRLQVVKGNLQPVKKISVTVALDKDPEPLEIELVGTGLIFGKVINLDGRPIEGAAIVHRYSQNPVLGGDVQNYTADANGEYRIEGIIAGTHSLTATDSTGDLTQTRTINVVAGEEKNVDFNFTGLVELTGTIMRDGKQLPQQQVLYFYLQRMTAPRDEESIAPTAMKRTPEGGYKIYVPAGDYYVQDTFVSGFRSAVGEYSFSANPPRQTLDFDIKFAQTDIIIVLPEGQKFKPGTLVIEQRGAAELPLVTQDMKLTSAQKRLTLCTFGQYRARFLSDDNSLSGSSEWTALNPADENAIVVDVGGGEIIRIGEWNPETITTEAKVHTFDASGAVKSPGNYDVIVDFESGQHGVSIEGFSVTNNGETIASDPHFGWTGTSNRNNTYRFNISDYRPGNYQVNITLRSDGGTMSKGAVFLAKQ